MPIDASTDTAITYADLQDLRTVLITVHTCLSARDLSDSAASTLGEVRYRPLTREVERVLGRIKGLLGDLMMEHIDDDEPEPEEDEDDEEVELAVEEALSENPLGSRTIVMPPMDHFEWIDGIDGEEIT